MKYDGLRKFEHCITHMIIRYPAEIWPKAASLKVQEKNWLYKRLHTKMV